MIIETVSAFAGLCLLEAFNEKFNLLMKDPAPKDPQYPYYNKMEHRTSGAFYVVICALVTIQFFTSYGWSLSVPLLFWVLITCRRLFFDYGLKLFRKRKLYLIEGDQFVDSIVRKILGAKGGYVEVVLLAATLAFCIILLERFSP